MSFAESYKKQVSLLLNVMPIVAHETCFALKGGSAINLFYQDMPRLSVDLDLVYLLHEDRINAIQNINLAMNRIKDLLNQIGLQASCAGPNESKKITCSNKFTSIKIEPNYTLRGSIYPVQKVAVCQRVLQNYGSAQMQVLARDELYAGKFCAALDRQHPRDLFDVRQMYSTTAELTEKMIQCFVIYLLGHNRPVHELLDCEIKNRRDVFDKEFIGMTDVPISYEELQDALMRLKRELKEKLLVYKNFLLDFVSLNADFSKFPIAEILSFPAIQWKMKNLEQLKKSNKKKFELQRNMLESYFSKISQ